MTIDTTQEYILCAAIHYVDYPDSPIVPGKRHNDCIHLMLILTGRRTVTNAPDGVGYHKQGFLTSKGRFVDRREGFKIASLAHQIRGAMMDKSELYSEDLY